MIVYLLYFSFILFSSFLALIRPTYFVIYYLLVTTKMLGFFGVEDVFILGGLGLGSFTLNIITLVTSILRGNTFKKDIRAWGFIILFCSFLTYGILKPLFDGNSTYISAIIGSKEFWSIAFFIYLIRNLNLLNIEIIVKSALLIGIFISGIYIVYFVFHIAPPFYMETKYYNLSMRGYFPTYISLAVFITYYLQYKEDHIIYSFNYFILFIGLIFSGHTSLVAGTAIGFLFLILKNGLKFPSYRIASLICFILILVTTVLFTLEKEITLFGNKVINNSEASLRSRNAYNKFRWDAISKKPISGYGFLHKSSKYFKTLKADKDNLYMQRFGTIDSGYVDLFLKFGFVGTVIYLFVWLSAIVSFLKPNQYGILTLAMSGFLLPYYLINYTWSVFSYQHGLVPGFLALFIIFKTQRIDGKNNPYFDYDNGSFIH